MTIIPNGKLHKATYEKFRKNAIKYVSSLTQEEKRNAEDWYWIANKEASRLALETGNSIELVAKVIAVLSVGIKWETNLKDASNLLQGFNKGIEHKIVVSTYKKNKQKAIDILNGVNDLLPSAQKTYAFYRNILEPYSVDTLTIDRHAYKALNGITKGGSVFVSESDYKKLELGYRQLAREYGYKSPASFQAVVWEGYKKTVGR